MKQDAFCEKNVKLVSITLFVFCNPCYYRINQVTSGRVKNAGALSSLRKMAQSCFNRLQLCGFPHSSFTSTFNLVDGQVATFWTLQH